MFLGLSESVRDWNCVYLDCIMVVPRVEDNCGEAAGANMSEGVEQGVSTIAHPTIPVRIPG